MRFIPRRVRARRLLVVEAVDLVGLRWRSARAFRRASAHGVQQSGAGWSCSSHVVSPIEFVPSPHALGQRRGVVEGGRDFLDGCALRVELPSRPGSLNHQSPPAVGDIARSSLFSFPFVNNPLSEGRVMSRSNLLHGSDLERRPCGRGGHAGLLASVRWPNTHRVMFRASLRTAPSPVRRARSLAKSCIS